MSFRFEISDRDRATVRFVSLVRKALQKAFVAQRESAGLTQAKLGRVIDKKPEQISRWLHGEEALSLRTIAELSWALGYEPNFSLKEIEAARAPHGKNEHRLQPMIAVSTMKDTEGREIESATSASRVSVTYG